MKQADNMLRDSVNELDVLRESIRTVDNFDPELYKQTKPPYVSIYMPVQHKERTRRRDTWTADEFKDLAKDALRRLDEKYTEEQTAGLRDRIDYLQDHPDMPLWLNAGKGLAFLMSNTGVEVLNLSFAPQAAVVIGDEYYIKPLLRNFRYGMSYLLLLLNSDRFALLRGDYDGVHYLPLLPSVHQEFAEMFDTYDGDEAALDYYSLEGHMSPYHDHKSRNEVTQEETEKFFRHVNKFMNDIVAKVDPTPVILVTLPEHDAMFRRICTFDTLLPDSILKDARTLSGDTLRDDAVAIIDKDRKAQLKKVIDHYDYEASKGKGSDDLVKIGTALMEKNVATLFVEMGKGMPGTFDAATGTITFDEHADPTDDKLLDPASPDVVDQMAQAALKQDAVIYVLGADEMPTKNGVAAIFRHEQFV